MGFNGRVLGAGIPNPKRKRWEGSGTLFLSHLLEHQGAFAWSHGLGQLCDAALIQVRPGEAPMVDEYLGATVLPIGGACGVSNSSLG